MQQGLDAYRATGSLVRLPRCLDELAAAHARAGDIEIGLALVAEAMTVVEETGERLYEAELHRHKGELLLNAASDMRHAEVTPEACFQKAIDIARRQQAKSPELCAATSLARLWQSQGKRKAAHDLLASVYGWFTEGFDTADLKGAKTLLDKLS
jgi:predicted ATPase